NDSLGGCLRVFVLPDTDDSPPCTPKTPCRVRVSQPILLNLPPPPAGVGLGPSPVLRATVPKAPVDKHCHSGSNKGEVRATPHPWDAPIDEVPKPKPV